MQLANEQFFSSLWNGLPKNNGFYYTWGLQLSHDAPSNPQYLELPVTDTEVCVLGGRLPFETCILWIHTQNYYALYCEAYRRLTGPNRKCLPPPFSILSENNILGCDWVSEKHFNIYPTQYFRQFLFFSWGAHTDSRKFRLSPIFQVKKWEACKQLPNNA